MKCHKVPKYTRFFKLRMKRRQIQPPGETRFPVLGMWRNIQYGQQNLEYAEKKPFKCRLFVDECKLNVRDLDTVESGRGQWDSREGQVFHSPLQDLSPMFGTHTRLPDFGLC